MSNSPAVTFTSDEQIQLNHLTDNARKFKNLLILLQNNSFKGSDAEAVIESIRVAQDLYNQTQQVQAQIEQVARNRASQPIITEPPLKANQTSTEEDLTVTKNDIKKLKTVKAAKA